MFREIFLLRAENVGMDLNPEASQLLAMVSRADRKPVSTASRNALAQYSSYGSEIQSNPCREKCHELNWKELQSSNFAGASFGSFMRRICRGGEIYNVANIGFAVYAAIHIFGVISVFLWKSVPLMALCISLYVVRMFGITAGYHRLLSHRAYKTSRAGQFIMAFLGCTAFQKGPIWWASHHRHHHRTADTPEDVHSPVQWGFWWSHCGWFLCTQDNAEPLWSAVPDLVRYPELLWLERYHYLPPFFVATVLYIFGGVPAVGWGSFVSTVLCWHATYCINSIAHIIGSRRFRCEFNTHCDARNNWWLAIATLGEGWHNNHHCYMRSARHGFYAHEVDMTWYILLFLEKCCLIWDVELPPLRELESHRFDEKHLQCRCEHVHSDLQSTGNYS